MAQSIKNISIGSKIKDNKGNIFTVIAKNHYGSNQVTLMHTNAYINMQMHTSHNRNSEYGYSEVHYYLSNDYLKRLQDELKDSLLATQIYYNDAISTTQYTTKSLSAKAFIPAYSEIGDSSPFVPQQVKFIDYFYNNNYTTNTKKWNINEK